MAYRTYITEAIVCGHDDVHGANRAFLLFTRDLGMVYAHAQSVREERSKHRYSLQVCSHTRVTLVHGKSGWRVVGAEPIQNFYSRAQTRAERGFVRATMLLLTRFVRGETAHSELFDDFLRAYAILPNTDPETLKSLVTLRTLFSLGYIAPSETTLPLLTHPLTRTDVEQCGKGALEEVNEMITYARHESHL